MGMKLGIGYTHTHTHTHTQRTTQTPFYLDPGTSKPIFVIYSVYWITQYNKWCTCGAWDDSHMSKPAELKNKIVLHWSSRWRNNTSSILNFSISSGPSLVQSSAPVFDRILYAKTKGEGLGERVTCVMSGRCEGRCEGGSTWRRILQSFLWYFVQELETITFKRQWQYSLLFGRLEVDQCRVCELQWLVTTPLASTSHHAHDSFSQPFPLHFCILQVIKNWRQKRPWNEANYILYAPHQSL